jgi:hypothetical protein
LGSISVDEPEPVCRRWGDEDPVDDDESLSVSRRSARGGLESLPELDAPDELEDPDEVEDDDELDDDSPALRRPARGGLELSVPDDDESDDDEFEDVDVVSRRWLVPEVEESDSEEVDPDEIDSDEVEDSAWRRSLVPADDGLVLPEFPVPDEPAFDEPD